MPRKAPPSSDYGKDALELAQLVRNTPSSEEVDDSERSNAANGDNSNSVITLNATIRTRAKSKHKLAAILRTLIESSGIHDVIEIETKFTGSFFSAVSRGNSVAYFDPDIEKFALLLKRAPKSAASDFMRAMCVALASPNRSEAEQLLKSVTQLIERQTAPQTGAEITAPPTVAPALYVPHKSGKPSEFLMAHWGPWLEAGVLYQHHLRKLDPKLVDALSYEFRGRREELKAILPPISTETARILADMPDAPRSPGARSTLASRRRAKPAQPK